VREPPPSEIQPPDTSGVALVVLIVIGGRTCKQEILLIEPVEA
jgi:hypothetical protein